MVIHNNKINCGHLLSEETNFEQSELEENKIKSKFDLAQDRRTVNMK